MKSNFLRVLALIVPLAAIQANAHPDDDARRFSAEIQRHPEAPVHYQHRAEAYMVAGRYNLAHSDLQEALRRDRHNPVILELNARYYATCPDASYRHPDWAVSFATEACVESEWHNGFYVETLAAGYAEMGDFRSAVIYQRRAIDLLPREFVMAGRGRLSEYEQRRSCRSLRFDTPTYQVQAVVYDAPIHAPIITANRPLVEANYGQSDLDTLQKLDGTRYDVRQVGQGRGLKAAVIIDLHQVKITDSRADGRWANSTQNTSTAVGAIAGGVIGHNSGTHSTGNTVVGALVGGIAGNLFGKAISPASAPEIMGVEYIVRLVEGGDPFPVIQLEVPGLTPGAPAWVEFGDKAPRLSVRTAEVVVAAPAQPPLPAEDAELARAQQEAETARAALSAAQKTKATRDQTAALKAQAAKDAAEGAKLNAGSN